MNKKLYYFMHKVLCRVTLFHLLLTWYCLLYYIVHLQTDTLLSPIFAAGLSSQHSVEPDASFSFSAFILSKFHIFLVVVSCVLN